MDNVLFVDRDGCIVEEPWDEQLDRLDKFRLLPGVIPALLRFVGAGYKLVMVTNQDGLGTASFPKPDFDLCHDFLLALLRSQGITFSEVLICPHKPEDTCGCRKPRTGLLVNYLASNDWNRSQSAMIGDRDSDMELAKNIGVRGLRVGVEITGPEIFSWQAVAHELLDQPRRAKVVRKTSETNISIECDLDSCAPVKIHTGIGFFDHMLESFAKHSGIALQISCDGDLHIDDHHSVEDIGIALGQALKVGLADKRGIQRFGFLLPMDESCCQVALDLGGRPYLVFEGVFHTPAVGGLSTSMVPHFFRSFAEALGANLHIKVSGENDHHMVEACFKALARSLKDAIKVVGGDIPSAKGVL